MWRGVRGGGVGEGNGLHGGNGDFWSGVCATPVGDLIAGMGQRGCASNYIHTYTFLHICIFFGVINFIPLVWPHSTGLPLVLKNPRFYASVFAPLMPLPFDCPLTRSPLLWLFAKNPFKLRKNANKLKKYSGK